jgi:hypothetical protein
MTKLRAPLTVDAALARIAGQLPDGWNSVSEIAGRQPRHCRRWGDPDAEEQIPIDVAIRLDLAFQAEGGTGAPILEAYAAQLELASAARFADRNALLRQAVDVIREGGEAHAAIVRSTQPDASPADERIAYREACEAFEALKKIIPLLAEQPP